MPQKNRLDGIRTLHDLCDTCLPTEPASQLGLVIINIIHFFFSGFFHFSWCISCAFSVVIFLTFFSFRCSNIMKFINSPFHHVLFFPAPILGCGQRIGSRVVNGQNEQRHAWPWQISLRVNGQHICGGSIISPRWGLTASHCVERNPYPRGYTVNVGKFAPRTPGLYGANYRPYLSHFWASVIFMIPTYSLIVAFTRYISPILKNFTRLLNF